MYKGGNQKYQRSHVVSVWTSVVYNIQFCFGLVYLKQKLINFDFFSMKKSYFPIPYQHFYHGKSPIQNCFPMVELVDRFLNFLCHSLQTWNAKGWHY